MYRPLDSDKITGRSEYETSDNTAEYQTKEKSARAILIDLLGSKK